MSDPVSWPPCVDRALAAPPGLVAFDMDGTLIEGDVGELVLRRRAAAGEALPALRALLGSGPLVPAYEAALRGPPARHYLACGLAGEGETAASLAARVAALFADGTVVPRPPAVALARALAAAGHAVWIVTGTLRLAGEAVAACLDLPVAGVLGQELAVADGRLSGRPLGPVLCGPGKVEAWWAHHDRAPLLVVGDTPNDLPLMGLGTLGSVAVPRAGEPMVAAARSAGVPVVTWLPDAP